MDVVIGSGVRGQSYLYWHGDLLYELPVSYWSDGSRWINSPGYKNGTMNFSRAVIPRCLECHATQIVARSPDPLSNQYDPTSLVTGNLLRALPWRGRRTHCAPSGKKRRLLQALRPDRPEKQF